MNTAGEAQTRGSLPYAQWVSLVALLAAEALTLSVRFQAMHVPRDMPCYWLIFYFPRMARLGFVAGLAALLLVGPRWYRLLYQERVRLKFSAESFAAITGNLVAFLCFYRLCAAIIEDNGPPYHLIGLKLVAWGTAGLLILAFWGMAFLPGGLWVSLVRQSVGRLAAGSVLGTVAFAVGRLAADQWRPLSRATLWVVHGLLTFVVPEVISSPEEYTVGTPSFVGVIAPECSGYEGIGLIVVFLSAALWMFRRDLRFPRAFALVPLAIVLIWLANAVRIAALIAIGTWGYPDFASGAFHSLAGWFMFLVIGLSLIAGARRMRYFSALLAEPRNAQRVVDAAYLVPAMAIIATAMVTSALSPGFDRFYAARVLAALLALLCYRRSYSELRLRWSWEAVAIGIGVFALWLGMERYTVGPSAGSSIRSGLDALPREYAVAWLILRVIGSVITVPLAEELAFRGYLTRRLISRDFQSVPPGRMTWCSLVVSSLLFGALHGRWIAGTVAGIAYGLAYRRRGELCDAVVAHGVTNGLIAVMVLANGSWSLWA
jgi:exosortase E/protease (VPEID-CTERM system)